MANFKVTRGGSLTGELRVPGDKSISHRAMMLAGASDGRCEIRGFLPSEDCLATLAAMRSMGAEIEALSDGDEAFGHTAYAVTGRGMQLSAPAGPIDCGNSGTTMRLFMGLLAGQAFASELHGDASLSKRPMKRVAAPLTEMGARITLTGESGHAPVCIDGRPLKSTTYELPVASAQVKSAILLAGLFANGRTTVIEPVPTRDHTERMLRGFRVALAREGQAVRIEGGQRIRARDFRVPGDISSAAFWIAAAAARPGSRLFVKDVGLNPTRTGVLDVLRRMGADIVVTPTSEEGEPIGTVEVRGRELRGTEIGGAEIPNIIDELPILAVAGTLAEGETLVRDAAELKVKESDRIHAVVVNLRALGAEVEEYPDGMRIRGGRALRGAVAKSFGDHRIAMAFAVAGLFAEGETVVEDVACVRTSYPNFESHLQRFMADENYRREPEAASEPRIG